MLGDSSAGGLGVEHAQTRRPARCWRPGSPSAPSGRCISRSVGAGSAHEQRPRRADRPAADARPDLAVVMVGANDVTHRVRPPTAVRHLDQAVRRLRDDGAPSRRRHLPRPRHGRADPAAAALGRPREPAGSWPRPRPSRSSRRAARTVSLGDILGPEFAAAPDEMFGRTASTRRPPATPAPPRRCCRRCAQRSDVWFGRGRPPDLDAAARACCRSRVAAVEAADEPAPRSPATRSAARDRGPARPLGAAAPPRRRPTSDRAAGAPRTRTTLAS